MGMGAPHPQWLPCPGSRLLPGVMALSAELEAVAEPGGACGWPPGPAAWSPCWWSCGTSSPSSTSERPRGRGEPGAAQLGAGMPSQELCAYDSSPAPSLAQHSDVEHDGPRQPGCVLWATLLPVPAGQDPVASSAVQVNQLVQTLIIQPARVFPGPGPMLPGPIYEKCMAPPSASCLG